MDYTQIGYDVAGGVATLELRRPARRNAWTRQMGVEVRDALARADVDDGVRALVVTGAGKDFCVGADVEGGQGGVLQQTQKRAPLACWRVRKPVIGALRGACAGVGATLPLQFDVRLAGTSARFAFVFVRRGLVPEAASTWLLPRLVGMSRASEILLAGRTVLADEALAIGLVSRVVPDDEVLGAAQALGREIAIGTAPVAVALTKRLLWRMAAIRDPDAADALDAAAFGWAKQTADAREGIRAFAEKRDPAWTMRPSVDLPDVDDLEDE